MRLCSFPDCGRPFAARELCNGHYVQLKRTGVLKPLRDIRTRQEVAARDETGRKFCIRGAHWLDESDFSSKGPTTDGLQSICRKCMADDHRLRTYGISSAQFRSLLESQGGSCPICGVDTPGGTGWHVDHDHSCCPGVRSCGECLRAILCHSCNIGLGHFRDSADLLERAAQYLKGVLLG